MYRLWEILLSNMSSPETFGMALVVDGGSFNMQCGGCATVRV